MDAATFLFKKWAGDCQREIGPRGLAELGNRVGLGRVQRLQYRGCPSARFAKTVADLGSPRFRHPLHQRRQM